MKNVPKFMNPKIKWNNHCPVKVVAQEWKKWKDLIHNNKGQSLERLWCQIQTSQLMKMFSTRRKALKITDTH